MTASIWNPGAEKVSVNADNTIITQLFVAGAGQTDFTLTAFEYAPATGSLMVFVNGEFVQSGLEELSSTSFRLSPALSFGDKVSAVGFVGVVSTTTDLAGNFSHAFNYARGTAGYKLKESISVLDSPFNCAIDGVSNVTASIQAAIDFAPAYSIVVIPENVTYKITQITLSKPITLYILGTLQPFVNPSSASPLIRITSDYVRIAGEGVGTIDGISLSYAKANGIYANLTSGRLKYIEVTGLRFKNLGIDSTLAYCTDFDCVDYPAVENCFASRCGVVSNVGGGGFVFYTQFCKKARIQNNVIDDCGSTGINDSAGIDTIISGNQIDKIALFGIKGGFAPNVTTVTNDVIPTQFTFSVANSVDVKRKIISGSHLTVFNTVQQPTLVTVSEVVDGGAYLQIFVRETLDIIPETGCQIQLLCSTKIWNNSITTCGDNGLDFNGWFQLSIKNNIIDDTGSLRLGDFGVLAAGIWVGYDPQGSYNKMRSSRLEIESNEIYNTYGSGISIMSTVDSYSITANTCINFNRRQDPDFGGIDSTRLSFYKSSKGFISDNFLRSAYGYAIYSNYSNNVIISNNNTYTPNGIMVGSSTDCEITNNTVVAISTSTSAFGIQTLDASGVNPNSGIHASGNTINVAGGFGIINTDTNFRLPDSSFNNNITGSGVSTVGLWVALSRYPGEYLSSSHTGRVAFSSLEHSQYLTGQVVTLPDALDSSASVFLLAVNCEQSANVHTPGLYLVTRAGTQKTISTLLNCTEVTVAVNGSNQITVTNITGANRTLSATITKLM